jgi:diguanylate cyclase
MSPVLIDLGFALTVAVLGAAGGWWLRGSGVRRQSMRNGAEERRNREVLSRLHDLAARVASDVGQHQSRVEEINEELVSAKTPESDAVVTVVTRLINTNRQMQEQLATAREKLREQAKQMECSAAEARTDALTGLANRRALDQEMACQFEAFQRYGRRMALVMVDVDHFKRFNDTYGHQVGDRVLCGLAGDLLRQAMPNDLVSRYGGEEFALVLPGTSLETARARAEKLREAVEAARYRDGGAELRVTISIGVAALAAGDDDPAGLIRRADAALYASKQNGRNRVSWHDGRQVQDRTPQTPPLPPEPQIAEAKPQPSKEPQPPAEESAGHGHDLCNRAAFCKLAQRRLDECRQAGRPVSVLLLRVDGFSEILAAYGQPASSLATRITVQLLGASFQGMDAAGQFEAGTFAALLPGMGTAQAVALGERLRLAIARCKFPLAGQSFRFTVSVAGAEAHRRDDLQRLLERLEETLDAAAATGGNCTFLHTGQSPEPAGVDTTTAPAASACGTAG